MFSYLPGFTRGLIALGLSMLFGYAYIHVLFPTVELHGIQVAVWAAIIFGMWSLADSMLSETPADFMKRKIESLRALWPALVWVILTIVLQHLVDGFDLLISAAVALGVLGLFLFLSRDMKEESWRDWVALSLATAQLVGTVWQFFEYASALTRFVVCGSLLLGAIAIQTYLDKHRSSDQQPPGSSPDPDGKAV